MSAVPAATLAPPAPAADVGGPASPCDFCRAPVAFHTATIGAGPFTGLVPDVEGSGSDHIATWCAQCGPLHRTDR